MRFRLAAVLGLAASLALAAPAAANHDNGNGKSQDHLHRQNGTVSGGDVVTASEPFTIGLIGLGLGAAALVARRRR